MIESGRAIEPKETRPSGDLARPPPLILDLDGTLIATDTLAETLLLYLKESPIRVVQALIWLSHGVAHLKRHLAAVVALDIDRLPVRPEALSLALAASADREVYIATAADSDIATAMAARFPCFAGAIGSQGEINLKGSAKAAALTARFPDGFDYVGDSPADLPVWRAARGATYIGPSATLARRLRREKPDAEVVGVARAGPRVWAKALRLHQWSKNLLLFVPLALGGKALDTRAWTACLLGFIALGLLASSTYVLNDLLDLQDDRAHWSKKDRAFASGEISPWVGLWVVPLGLAAGFAVGAFDHRGGVIEGLIGYLALTLLYSFRLKREPVVDATVLGGLYTLRLAIGVLCAQVAWSTWLLVFSMFMFTSLSFAKRFTELERLATKGGDKPAGRGYRPADRPVVLALGVSLSSAAVLVMVMYLIEEAFRAKYYKAPHLLWALPIILALWLGRVWLLCGRGELNDDPVAFAVRDPVSLVLGGVIGFTLAAALML